MTRRDRAAAVRQRDAAFRRIGRVRGWTIAGAGALTAAIAVAVSAAVPGRTLGAKAATRTSSRRPVSPRMPALATPRQLGLRPPQSAPQPAPQPPPQPAAAPQPAAPSGGVVSGGS